MTFIEEHIAEQRAASEEYRKAYDEEVELTRRRETLTRALTSARKESGMSQRRMAAALRISPRRLRRIETGLEPLSMDRLLEILAVLEMDIALVNDANASRVRTGQIALGT